MLLAAPRARRLADARPEIRDNLMAMILAGHETTTGELAWAFQLLAHHPAVQDRLIEEIDSEPRREEYLTATVHETMRHKPVFLFAIPREGREPVEIGGWTYRPPAHLAACTYLMHHHPELYPRPHQFRPERFIDEAPQPRTWLPWGGGRKHCLGRHFALLEVKTILRERARHQARAARERSRSSARGGAARSSSRRRGTRRPTKAPPVDRGGRNETSTKDKGDRRRVVAAPRRPPEAGSRRRQNAALSCLNNVSRARATFPILGHTFELSDPKRCASIQNYVADSLP